MAGEAITLTQVDNSAPRGIQARKDNGQEKVIDLKPLSSKADHLLKLKASAEAAKADYSDACKAVAEESGLNAAVVAKYINARYGDTYIEAKRNADQLSLLFDEIGQGLGGGLN